jgi:pilus assembly protein CpaB
MRTNNIVILVLAVSLGAVAAFLARNWLLSQTQTVSSTGTVVVASQNLPFGTQLSEDNLTEITWGSSTLPEGAFTSRQALFKDGSRATLGTLARNEPIIASKITGPGRSASLSATIEDGKRAVTVRVDDVRGVAGFIMPNDHVDVVLIRAANGVAQPSSYSDLLLQNVKVIAVDQVAADQKEKPSVAKAVTLEVTPAEAQQVALATEIGTLSLILRQPNEAKIVQHDRVTESDLGEAGRKRQVQTSPDTSRSSRLPTTELARSAADLSTVPVYVLRDIRKDAQKYLVIKEGYTVEGRVLGEVLDGPR